uniref:Uncharacterized protein n=1 Tax=Myoviridae sp. ctYA416 TaxID=2825125 RepID=A0A8S5UT98_9CAUD|nr:MAG TPA: hypothetical protein [Myoviridae sp. ctYA416]
MTRGVYNNQTKPYHTKNIPIRPFPRVIHFYFL